MMLMPKASSSFSLVIIASLPSVLEAFVVGPTPTRFLSNQQNHSSDKRRFSVSGLEASNGPSSTDDVKEEVSENVISADLIYMDIEVAGNELGRLVFQLTSPSPLPRHAENVIQLCKGSRRGIDPKAHYVGCEFDYSPASIEDGMGRYRWGHQLRGRGRNAIGKADEAIVDVASQSQCANSCFGGQYYKVPYSNSENEGDPGVFLTVPVLGPGLGSSKFKIVRVGESSTEWGERLLTNSGVIGRLSPASLLALHAMARQRVGPPTIVAAGVLDN